MVEKENSLNVFLQTIKAICMPTLLYIIKAPVFRAFFPSTPLFHYFPKYNIATFGIGYFSTKRLIWHL